MYICVCTLIHLISSFHRTENTRKCIFVHICIYLCSNQCSRNIVSVEIKPDLAFRQGSGYIHLYHILPSGCQGCVPSLLVYIRWVLLMHGVHKYCRLQAEAQRIGCYRCEKTCPPSTEKPSRCALMLGICYIILSYRMVIMYIRRSNDMYSQTLFFVDNCPDKLRVRHFGNNFIWFQHMDVTRRYNYRHDIWG